MLPLDVRALLRRFQLHPKKGLGQNFLVDEGALKRVAAAAALTSADTVLEIGPGLGSLTRHLAAAAGRVVAVELDEALRPALEFTLKAQPNVDLRFGDILELPLADFQLPAAYKVVANIPYYITSAVIRHVLEAAAKPALIVLTMQREVAERLCAGPGDMSLLAVSAQFYGAPRVVARIPPGAFHPRPAVDSAVVRLDVFPEPVVTAVDTAQFFRVAKAGFSQKRKQLRNSLSGGLRLEAAQVEDWLKQAGIDPKRRAETLTLAEWGALARALVPGR
jgi:16S rRNA (adenine1518-N6/adenine1519-N6)-dimethyltransferase